ncbi:hypothetical protein Q763_09200 [Flavobacterium beibuense F44-8]|uniref:Uncharacterized protein n=2 Tax=Flavobacterium beibuense TaxID=657326 RepID=A0A0A2LPX3_9FLAO|nr:hypothetical protein Q763_09200 [Flavobacterium beibuense F44-8]
MSQVFFVQSSTFKKENYRNLVYIYTIPYSLKQVIIMKNTNLTLLIFSFILFSCTQKKEDKKIADTCNHNIDTTRIITSNDERLNIHFSDYAIVPAIIINNITGNQTNIDLFSHKIEWFDNEKETYMLIDKQKVSLKDQLTINQVTNLQKDNVDFANNWRQIRLYKYNNKEILLIELVYTPCTGLGCSVSYYLLYDTDKRVANYYGTYAERHQINLFNYGNGEISFVSESNITTPACDQKKYNLYTMDDKGIFQLQRKEDGNPYEIDQYYSEERLKEYEHLTQNWIKEVK